MNISCYCNLWNVCYVALAVPKYIFCMYRMYLSNFINILYSDPRLQLEARYILLDNCGIFKNKPNTLRFIYNVILETRATLYYQEIGLSIPLPGYVPVICLFSLTVSNVSSLVTYYVNSTTKKLNSSRLFYINDV